jgi:uncharacterized membrane protein
VEQTRGQDPPEVAGHGGTGASAELAPIISRSLMVGVLLSAVIVVVGFVLYAVSGTSGYPAGVWPVAIGQVLAGTVQGRPFAIVDFGLVLLILTPVFRVAVGIVGFAREHDPNMVAATSYVLCMLVLSFMLGKAGG